VKKCAGDAGLSAEFFKQLEGWNRDAWASEAGQFRGSEDVFWIANVEAVGSVRTGGTVDYSNP